MMTEDSRELEHESMSLDDCAFIMEDLAFQSEIVRSIFFSVQEQLTLDMCRTNQAVLHGISDMIWKLDKKMQEFTKQLFCQIKRGM